MGQLFSKRIRLEDISLDNIIIVVIGPSGVGKSTFINTAAGRPLLRVNDGLEPYTTRVEHVRCTIQSEGSLKNVVFVDTPAFPDPGSDNSGLKVETKIQDWSRQTFGRNIKITGILYLHNISENRMTQPPLPHHEMFRRLCGEGFYARVLLVTTMWEKLLNQDDGERRKAILRIHWGEMINKGSAVVCHDGTKESAWSVVNALMDEATDHRANSSRPIGTTHSTTPTTNHFSLDPRSLPPSSLSVIQLPVDPRQIGAEASSQEVRDFISSERCDLCADDAPLSSVPLDSTSSYPPAAVLLAYRLFHYIGTQKFETRSFHSTMLPNLQVSVYCALTTFETGISPWMHPSQWLDANIKHIRSIFNGIVDLTENADIKAVRFPATMIFQRLMVYIIAHNMLCSSDKILLGKFNATLKKCQDRDILNLMRNQGNIKNELLVLFRNASPKHREMQFEDLLKKLLVLDSMALSANVEVLVADENTCEEFVETQGPGAQSLVNVLHARLDFPMDSAHKLLLVQVLTRLTQRSGFYPESLTLTDVTPERGRRATGGFADVYKGICLGEDIALKVFKYPLPSGVDSLNSLRSSDDRFHNLLREFITWRQLSHPNVLPFYGVHFLEDTLEIRFCLVSPWMENGNIVEFLARRNRMGPDTDATNCVSLALDIAHGIKYLHGENIIHRDLKGYNILISPSTRAYIADFGLATLTDSGSATMLAGSAITGTPRWLAPELIPHAEVKRRHTYASDIYAFALVCYEMFSGKIPFEEVGIYDLKFHLQRGERPFLPANDLSRRRGLSLEMEGLIQDCWNQEPTKRPSADEVVERLQLLQLVDQRPPNEIGTSFFMQLLQNQVDNPFAILSREYYGSGLRA